MDVILTQDIEKLGKLGDVVKVKDGFARNYLMPRSLAHAASPAALRQIEIQKKKQQALYELAKSEARDAAGKLSKVSCAIDVEVNEQGKLYGSVTTADIAKALAVEGHVYSREDITIDNPIEELGIFEAGVRLHPEVTAKIRVWVTKR
ncbi:MAG: 50S ribosomal protein L9 [Candidatus Omnitrophica bacterium CG12_big_fil_rev_8_21_14_0_65_50_5]|nr:MAG: 50S ribosomal protein L9 [Candidatus Omnitrophica bacterium CG12_big_fil_rev_8_21_14_0_65_50_5]